MAVGEAIAQAGYLAAYEGWEELRAALLEAAGLDLDVTTLGTVELRPRSTGKRLMGAEAETTVRQLLQGLRAAVMEHPPDAAELAALETRYRQHLVRWFESLEFRGMMRAPKPIRLPLEEVYVELRSVAEVPEAADSWSAEERRLLLEAEGRNKEGQRELLRELETLRRERWSRQIPERSPLAGALLARDRRAFVVLGDPGSGKTTLLHFLALVFARGPETAAARLGIDPLEAGRLPIFAPLAAFDDMLRERPGLTLAEFLPLYYDRRRGLPGLGPLFHRALESGRALVLLDGFDEMLKESSRAYMAAQAGALISEGSARGVRFAITSRFVGYREAPISGNVATLSLLDFGLPEIRLFAGRWARAFERFMAGGDTPEALEKARQLEAGLLSDVESNDSVRRLAANPLMLTMLALLRRQVGRLPQRRIQLFESYVGTLLEHWVEMRTFGERAEEPKKLDRITAESLLMPLALWLQITRPSGTASRVDMAAELTRISLAQAGLAEDKATSVERRAAEAEVERFFQEMRETVGILIERGHDAFGFLLLAFQEYFAGRALARLRDEENWAVLEPHLHDPRWREPLLLCAGWLGVVEGRRERVSDLVCRILSVQDPRERHLHRHLLLALTVAGDDVNLEPELVHDLARRAVRVYQKSQIPVLVRALLERLIRLVENGTVGFEEALWPALNSENQAIAYELLPRLGGREETVEILLKAIGAKPIRSLALVATLERLASESRAIRARLLHAGREGDGQALQALSGLSRGDEVVRGVLLQAFHREEGDYRRSVALSRLAPAVETSPEVRGLMLSSLEDPDLSVAIVAANALAGLAATDEKVREAFLRKLARPGLQATVAVALASFYEVDSRLRLALPDALKEASAEEHSQLLLAFGRFAEGNETLRKILWDGLEHAEEEVRRSAMKVLAGLPWVRGFDDFVRSQVAGPFWETRQSLAEILGNGEAPLEYLGLLEDIQANARDAEVAWILPLSLEPLEGLMPPVQLAENFIRPGLEHRTSQIRAVTVQALAPRVLEEPIGRAVLGKLEDVMYTVRVAAIKAISSRVAEEFIGRAVLEKLEDAVYTVRVAAINALSSRVGEEVIGRAVLGKLEDTVYTVRVAAIKALSLRVGEEEISRVVLGKLEDVVYDVRVAAIEALSSRMGDEEVDRAVLSKLEDVVYAVRVAAIEALSSRIGDEEIGRAVLNKLEDSVYAVRVSAIKAVSSRVGEEVIGRAVLGKLEDEDNAVRSAAIFALSLRVGEESIWRALVGKLEDEDNEVRLAAIIALSSVVGEEPVKKAILERLEDGSPQVRAAAFEVLSYLENRVPALQSRLESTDLWPVRMETLAALKTFAAAGRVGGRFWRKLTSWLSQEIRPWRSPRHDGDCDAT